MGEELKQGSDECCEEWSVVKESVESAVQVKVESCNSGSEQHCTALSRLVGSGNRSC